MLHLLRRDPTCGGRVYLTCPTDQEGNEHVTTDMGVGEIDCPWCHLKVTFGDIRFAFEPRTRLRQAIEQLSDIQAMALTAPHGPSGINFARGVRHATIQRIMAESGLAHFEAEEWLQNELPAIEQKTWRTKPGPGDGSGYSPSAQVEHLIDKCARDLGYVARLDEATHWRTLLVLIAFETGKKTDDPWIEIWAEDAIDSTRMEQLTTA